MRYMGYSITMSAPSRRQPSAAARAKSSIANVWLTKLNSKGVGGPCHVAWVFGSYAGCA